MATCLIKRHSFQEDFIHKFGIIIKTRYMIIKQILQGLSFNLVNEYVPIIHMMTDEIL